MHTYLTALHNVATGLSSRTKAKNVSGPNLPAKLMASHQTGSKPEDSGIRKPHLHVLSLELASAIAHVVWGCPIDEAGSVASSPGHWPADGQLMTQAKLHVRACTSF